MNNHLEDTLSDHAENLGEKAGDMAKNVQSRARDAWDSAQHRANDAVRETTTYVRENPVPTAFAVFVFGLVLGLVLNRREPETFEDRYIAKPLHQSRGMLLGLLVACGALLRKTFNTASSTAGEVAERVGDDLRKKVEPLSKAARRTSRRFGL